MSMNLQVEAVSGFPAQAAAAVLFPVLQELPPPSLGGEALPLGKTDGRLELPLDELSFHRLASPAEIGQILHLRGEINLPATALADPSFHIREKKETNMGWSAPFFAEAPTSGPSGSFRWIAGSLPVRPCCKGNRSFPAITTKAVGKWAASCLHPNTAAGQKR